MSTENDGFVPRRRDEPIEPERQAKKKKRTGWIVSAIVLLLFVTFGVWLIGGAMLDLWPGPWDMRP